MILRKLIIFLCFATHFCFGQIVVRFDDMESTSTWKGVRTPGTFSGYIGGNTSSIDLPANDPQFVSLDTCYRLLGTGIGSSTPEIDTLIFPNITGLDRTKRYKISFKLASIAYNPSVNLAAGVDQTDSIKLEWTASNGIQWFSEVVIIGNNNSSWGFTGAGLIINKNVSFGPTTFISYPTNPVREVNLTLPLNVGQLRIRMPMRVNASGESFLVEDVQVTEISTVLPVELGNCTLTTFGNNFRLDWVTMSESNSDFFQIDLMNTKGIITKVGAVQAAVNSTSPKAYSFIGEIPQGQNYVILKEIDLDGNVEILKTFYIVSNTNVDYSSVNDIYYRVNLLGQKVNNYEIIFDKTKKRLIYVNQE